MNKKLLKFASMLLVAVCLCVNFASCSDDDDEKEGNGGSSDGKENGYAYVDLGLPSGLKWATCNVGAENPWEYGNYFAWGETAQKSIYDWSTYKYGSSWNQISKYNTESFSGSVFDYKLTIEPADDPVITNIGNGWRLPTNGEYEELIANCYCEWTENYSGSGVSGIIVYKVKNTSDKGKAKLKDEDGNIDVYRINDCDFDIVADEDYKTSISATYTIQDKHIFFPSAGYYTDGLKVDVGRYWSSSLAAGDCYYGMCPSFDSDEVAADNAHDRCHGCPVRAVCENSGNNDYFQNVFQKSGVEEGYDYVDLGLPSGTKWATCNVGASSKLDFGDYFAWGETVPKNVYDWSTYLDGRISSHEDSWTDKDLLKDVTNIAGTQYDAAHTNMGGGWRMPTAEECKELIANCYFEWTPNYSWKGVPGFIVYKAKVASDKGKAKLIDSYYDNLKFYKIDDDGDIISDEDNETTIAATYSLSDVHIFFPLAGNREKSDFRWDDISCCWASSLEEGNSLFGIFMEDEYGVSWRVEDKRYVGRSVRGVHE